MVSIESCVLPMPYRAMSVWLKEAQHRLSSRTGFRLPALMDLYIHPLYVLVSKILSSILNSPASIHPLYHPLSTLLLWDRLVTLSKYIHV
jgi:hypothetical protein